MQSQQIIVRTKNHNYPINIFGKIDYGQQIVPFIKGNQVLVVTNDLVAPLYLQSLTDSLTKANEELTIICCELTDGEQYKNQDSINQIYDKLLEYHCSRDVTLIALGGGVIGDMTGFAAASYMRGVDFIQVPTTLLAQVDSSVGGKTGINHPLGKNMIGAFWQPQLVVADMSTLNTLPMRELSAGMAEVIKYALITDIEFLSWLEENMEAMMALDLEVLAFAVRKCCELKADMVAKDERESGIRATLNFGHTFGHVIETYMGYGNLLHGEAVSIGMMQASKLSSMLGYLSKADVDRVEYLLKRANLPVEAPKIPVDKALELMSHDKKSISGKIRLVLLEELGKSKITTEFDIDMLKQVLTH